MRQRGRFQLSRIVAVVLGAHESENQWDCAERLFIAIEITYRTIFSSHLCVRAVSSSSMSVGCLICLYLFDIVCVSFQN